MYRIVKPVMRFLLNHIYKVEIIGMDHYEKAGEKVLIISNHTSFLDPILLGSYLPGKVTFAVNTYQAQRWYVKFSRLLVRLFPMDPSNPLSIKSLIKFLQGNEKAVIFPEGRITVTGSLMKVYQGPGLIADKAGAMVLPIRIEGAQYTLFSKLRGRVRIRFFPKIRLYILPPRRIEIAPTIVRDARREAAGRILTDIMTEMMVETGHFNQKLFNVLLDSRSTHGGRHLILEDMQRIPISYNQLILQSFVLGRALRKMTPEESRIGILLPNSMSSVIAFFGMHLFGQIPALLDYTQGEKEILVACSLAKITTICASKRFLSSSKSKALICGLIQKINVLFVEDLEEGVQFHDKILSYISSKFARRVYQKRSSSIKPTDPAFIVFYSTPLGSCNGMTISHVNILANRQQLSACIDFNVQDIVFNPLPLTQSFSLTLGLFLPLLAGMKTFLYPTPVHLRIVPEIIYDSNATILISTNAFLTGYTKYAHPYDFYSIRYVFTGMDTLQDRLRQYCSEKLGIRIFESYCTAETRTVVSINTPMANKHGSAGRLLPKTEVRLLPVKGINKGKRLMVKGPNISCKTLLSTDFIEPPLLETELNNEAWYDTGELVLCDEYGYITVLGRIEDKPGNPVYQSHHRFLN